MNINDFIPKAQGLVARYSNGNLYPEHEPISAKDVYVVWSSKTLQNAKALLSTPLPDGMYYEVTYNGDKDEIYFDAYRKVSNIRYDMTEEV